MEDVNDRFHNKHNSVSYRGSLGMVRKACVHEGAGIMSRVADALKDVFEGKPSEDKLAALVSLNDNAANARANLYREIQIVEAIQARSTVDIDYLRGRASSVADSQSDLESNTGPRHGSLLRQATLSAPQAELAAMTKSVGPDKDDDNNKGYPHSTVAMAEGGQEVSHSQSNVNAPASRLSDVTSIDIANVAGVESNGAGEGQVQFRTLEAASGDKCEREQGELTRGDLNGCQDNMNIAAPTHVLTMSEAFAEVLAEPTSPPMRDASTSSVQAFGNDDPRVEPYIPSEKDSSHEVAISPRVKKEAHLAEIGQKEPNAHNPMSEKVKISRRNSTRLVIIAASKKLERIAVERAEASDESQEDGDHHRDDDDIFMADILDDNLEDVEMPARATHAEGEKSVAIEAGEAIHHSVPVQPRGVDLSIYDATPEAEAVVLSGDSHGSAIAMPGQDVVQLLVTHEGLGPSRETTPLSSPNSSVADLFDDQDSGSGDDEDNTTSADALNSSLAPMTETEYVKQNFTHIIESNWQLPLSSIFSHAIWQKKENQGRRFLGSVRRLSEMFSFEEAMSRLRDSLARQNKYFVTRLIMENLAASRSDSSPSETPETERQRSSAVGKDEASQAEVARNSATDALSEMEDVDEDLEETSQRENCIPETLPTKRKRKAHPKAYSFEELELLVRLKEQGHLSWNAIAEHFKDPSRSKNSLAVKYHLYQKEIGRVVSRKRRGATSPEHQGEDDEHTEGRSHEEQSGDIEMGQAVIEEMTDDLEDGTTTNSEQDSTSPNINLISQEHSFTSTVLPSHALRTELPSFTRVVQSDLCGQAVSMLEQNKEAMSKYSLGHVLVQWVMAVIRGENIQSIEELGETADAAWVAIWCHKDSTSAEKWAAIQEVDEAITDYVQEKGGMGIMNANRKVVPTVCGPARKERASLMRPVVLPVVEEMLQANPRPEKRRPVEGAIDAAQKFLLESKYSESVEGMESSAHHVFEAILERCRHNWKVKQSALSSLRVALNRCIQAKGWDATPHAEDTAGRTEECESSEAEQPLCENNVPSTMSPEVTAAPSPSSAAEQTRRSPSASQVVSEDAATLASRAQSSKEDDKATQRNDALLSEQFVSGSASRQLPETTQTRDLCGNIDEINAHEADASAPSESASHKCEFISPRSGLPCNALFSRRSDLERHEDTLHNGRKRIVRCPVCAEEKTFSRDDALKRHMRNMHPEVSPGTWCAAIPSSRDIVAATVLTPPGDRGDPSINDTAVAPAPGSRSTGETMENITIDSRYDLLLDGTTLPAAPPSEIMADAMESIPSEDRTVPLAVDTAAPAAPVSPVVVEVIGSLSSEGRGDLTVNAATAVPAPVTQPRQPAQDSVDNPADTASTGPSSFEQSSIDPVYLAADMLAANAEPKKSGATQAAIDIALRYLKARKPDSTAALETIAFELCRCIGIAAKRLYNRKAKDCADDSLDAAMDIYIEQNKLEPNTARLEVSRGPQTHSKSHTIDLAPSAPPSHPQTPATETRALPRSTSVGDGRPILEPTRSAPSVNGGAAKSNEIELHHLTPVDRSANTSAVAPSGISNAQQSTAITPSEQTSTGVSSVLATLSSQRQVATPRKRRPGPRRKTAADESTPRAVLPRHSPGPILPLNSESSEVTTTSVGPQTAAPTQPASMFISSSGPRQHNILPLPSLNVEKTAQSIGPASPSLSPRPLVAWNGSSFTVTATPLSNPPPSISDAQGSSQPYPSEPQPSSAPRSRAPPSQDEAQVTSTPHSKLAPPRPLMRAIQHHQHYIRAPAVPSQTSIAPAPNATINNLHAIYASSGISLPRKNQDPNQMPLNPTSLIGSYTEDYEPPPPNLNVEPPSRDSSPTASYNFAAPQTLYQSSHQYNPSPLSVYTLPTHSSPPPEISELVRPAHVYDRKKERKRRREVNEARVRAFEERGHVKDEDLMMGSGSDIDSEKEGEEQVFPVLKRMRYAA